MTKPIGRPPTPVLDRFFAKVPHRPEGVCWQWNAGKFSSGYGAMSMPREGRRHQNRPAHIVAYELFVGPVPEGMELDHTCHTDDLSCPGGRDCPHRGCVNPAHLEPVTHLTNAHRGRSKTVQSAVTGMCASGRHPMEDAYRHKGGGRQCRHCHREGQVNRRAK